MDESRKEKKSNYNEYYQDELFFLREMGREFAETHPMLSHYLTEAGSDPDVERLLEGFAFLTGRLRQKLDDELPELTHTVMGLLCPHYLRPVPAMTILEFEPQRTLRGKYLIPRNKTEVESAPVANTRCRFRTCYDVELLPISVDDVVVEGTQLKVSLRILNGVQFSGLDLDKIRLNIHGDPAIEYELYNMLCRYVQRIIIKPTNSNDNTQQVILDKTNIIPVGFDESEGIIPYPPNSFLGYRVVQEYFSFPDKFMFVDVTGLRPASRLAIQDSFEIAFQFSRRPNESLRIGKDNIHVNCTPVINLFSRSSDPIRVNSERTEYRVRPEGPNPQHYEVYSIDKVMGLISGTAQQYEYKPFYSFTHGERSSTYYQTRMRGSVTAENSTETYISFVNSEQSFTTPTTEIISMDLNCINRQLTEQLRLGDIKIPTSSSPEVARFRNITNITPTVYPQFGGSLHWKLISHLTLNKLSVTNMEALKAILSLYNFQSAQRTAIATENQKRLDSIASVQGIQRDRLYHGIPIRGTEIQIEIQEGNFLNDGDMYLFCCVLNEFLALYSTINSFTQLTVKGVGRGEVISWQMRIGKQLPF